MGISTEINFTSVDKLFLDPKNPRLGRYYTEQDLSQDEILDLMEMWTLDELAVSYLESGGFWIQEALLVVEEELNGSQVLVVVEGNRRLAALKFLKMAYERKPQISRKWSTLVRQYEVPPNLFDAVPYLQADTRQDIEAFLGFRHVTGIKEWATAEKAEFITKLIEQGMSYEEVRKKIGSRLATVRQNYIGFRLLQQLEEQISEFDSRSRAVQNRFSVMYLSLRGEGTQKYLQIDANGMPEDVRYPVSQDNLERLRHFSRWIFGVREQPPLFSDSREIGKFDDILLSPEAVQYLETTEVPNFDLAYQKAGGNQIELSRNLREAADLVQISLTVVHLYKSDDEIKRHVELLGRHMLQLLNAFPGIKEELFKDS